MRIILRISTTFSLVSLIFFSSFFSHSSVYAQSDATPSVSSENQDEIEEKKRKIDELQKKLNEVENQKVSLSSTIQYINTKISLSQAEIDKTQSELNKLERDLNDLSTRIGGLEQSLDVMTDVLIDRITESYKHQQTHPIRNLLLSQTVTEYFHKVKYVKISEQKTKEVMQKAESQRITFDDQKKVKELKQEEIEKKKVVLAQQQRQLAIERSGQQSLLNETRNDESKYQAELQKTLSELQAIQGIIAGKGTESKVREVKTGETIASIIQGASPCSNGTHLHFEVVKNGVHQNPAAYLSAISATWNNSPDGSFGFDGGWSWPMNNPAKINQGFGMTYFARVKRAYGGAPHTGIDMASKTSGDTAVKAVRDGDLFRGGISCGGRTLQYVRVIHKDDPSLSTYYLHVNY